MCKHDVALCLVMSMLPRAEGPARNEWESVQICLAPMALELLYDHYHRAPFHFALCYYISGLRPLAIPDFSFNN